MLNWQRWTLNKEKAAFGRPFYLHNTIDFLPHIPDNPPTNNEMEKYHDYSRPEVYP